MKRVRNSGSGSVRRTGFGRALEQSAKEILSHVKGDSKLPLRRVVLPDQVDVNLHPTRRVRAVSRRFSRQNRARSGPARGKNRRLMTQGGSRRAKRPETLPPCNGLAQP